MTSSTPHSKRTLAGRAVNPIGLGCMGMSEFYGPTDEAESLAVLEAALELGVEHFDTADMYGFGHNESLLGRFLAAPGRRDKVFLATKCGIVRDPVNNSLRGVDNSPAYIVEACERSLQRLGTHIDLFYLHRIADGGSQIEHSMEGMAQLLNDGKIGAVGLSEANADMTRRADAALRSMTDGRHGIAAIQSEYSLLTRTVEGNGVLDTCRELGAALVAYSPISRGLLSDDFQGMQQLAADDFRRYLPRFAEGALAHNQQIVADVRAIAEKHRASSAQVALAWLLHRSPIVHPIPGTKRISYLQQNAGAVQLQLDTADLTTLDQLLVARSVQGERYAPEALAAFTMDA